MNTLQAINPATNEVVGEYALHSAVQVSTIIENGHATFMEWRKTSFAERARLMRKAADLLLERKETLARLMASEMGKVLKGGIAEIEKCAGCCKHFAEHAESYLADQQIQTEFSKSYVSFQPIGVVLAIMPWNFPFWQVFRFAAPTLMAGNAGILKHASNTPGCAGAIETIFRDAGFPEGLFQNIYVPGKETAPIIGNPLIRAVTLTGSTDAGKKVAAEAGKHIKKCVLELGGSDAYVVLKDADIQNAAKICAESRLLNTGQSCIAAKRFIVEAPVLEEFTQAMLEHFKRQVVGDPMDAATTIGPMAREDLRDQLHEQVEKSIRQGATLLTGGEIPDEKGAYYPPTILTNVKPGMTAFDEELFGPVSAVISARDETEALQLANTTQFGLGGAVFTSDKTKGERLACEALEAGSCFVNALVRSDTRLPFGGVKESGYGRELSGFGIREFVNIKTVAVA